MQICNIAVLSHYTIVQWICLSLPFCRPGFESRVQNLHVPMLCHCYFKFSRNWIVKWTKRGWDCSFKTIHSSYESQKIFRLIQYFKWYQNFQKIFVTKFHPNYKMTKCFCNNVDLCRILAFGMTSQTYQMFY